jgi:hypothetical protein
MAQSECSIAIVSSRVTVLIPCDLAQPSHDRMVSKSRLAGTEPRLFCIAVDREERRSSSDRWNLRLQARLIRQYLGGEQPWTELSTL